MKTLQVAAVAWLLSAAWASGQASEKPPSAMLAENVFKNVQVLKGIPVDQFMGTMGFFSASLGMNCTDCHVDESGGNWAKYADDNAPKRTARRMMLMVSNINTTSFGGRQVVTCNTCHRGTRRPNVMPSLALLYGAPPPDEPGDPFEQAPGQPAADQVLDRYVLALGGPQRVGRLSSFVAKGTYKGFDDAEKSALEVFATSSGQRSTIVHTLSGDSTTTLDGRAAWIAAPETEKPVPLMAVTGQDLDGLKLEAQVLFPARIRQALGKWRVGAKVTIADREVQPVQGNDGRRGDRHALLRRGVRAARAAGALFRIAGRTPRHANRLRRLSRGRRRQDAVSLDRQLAGRSIDVRAERRAAERRDRRGEIRQTCDRTMTCGRSRWRTCPCGI